MTFPRQRHAGTRRVFQKFSFLSPTLSPSPIFPRTASAIAVPTRSSSRRSALRLTLTGLTLLMAPLSVSSVAQAAKTRKVSSQKLPGAPAWTRGSQTYLRAGYSTETPVVAKVAHGTQVFVWGKYNGWYRVETSDHKFGWVRHELLNCPKSDKIAYLAPSKARIASARSAHQKLYGSPAEVREHQAKYGIGVEARKAKIAKAAPKAKIAAKAPAKVAAKKAPTKVAARPVIVTPKAKPVASAPRVVTPRTASTASAARPSVVSVQQVRWERGEVALSPSRPSRTAELQNVPTERPAFASERKEGAVSSAPNVAATPAVVVPNVPASNAPIGVTRVDSAPVVRAPIATKATPVKAAPAKAAPAKKVAKAPIKKAPVKTVAKAAPKAPKLTAAQIRAQKRQAATDARRNSLRARLGTPRMAPPPVVANSVRPISPTELLRAREAFLAKQRNEKGNAQASNSENNGRLEPMSLPTPNTMSPYSASPYSVRVVPLLQRSPFSFQAPTFQDVVYDASTETTSGVEAWAPLSDNDDLNAAQWMALAKKVPQKATPNRGGSPRDFANGRGPNAGKQQLGQSLADQALTYRGTPYRYGASSPGRGFDCSGLIYYCLRQRGYNPPRTAAELAHYGKPVKRNELKSGDIVLFANTYKRGVSHVGIYIGNNNFVHAPNSNSRVRVDSLGSSYYSKKYHSARRAG